MKQLKFFGILIIGFVAFSTVTYKLIAAAVTAPNATYAVTTTEALSPNQAGRWQITLGSTGTVSRMTFGLQPEMLQSVSLANLHVVTTLPGGVLSQVSGGLQYTLSKPTSLTAGTRVWMTVQGVTTPNAGTWSSAVTVYASNGAKLASDTAVLTEQAQQPCRTTAWPSTYIQDENSLPGSTGWQIDEADTTQVSNQIAAYAENSSVSCGQTINLRVNDLDRTTLSITAYRLGYYGGTGARQVWTTSRGPWLLGYPQPGALHIASDSTGTINMVTAKNWSRSFSIPVDGSWTPGSYLLAIRTSNGQGRYVPIVVRDDLGVHAQKVILNSAEWQAYNKYGGYDAYTAPTGAIPSKRISFDRPYLQHSGAGNLLSFEYGYIYWGEKQNFDLSYVMDTDIFSDTTQLANQQMITLIGHPEYWTTDAYNALNQARLNGTNILSLTANALYWRIKMAPSTLTGANREFIITKNPGSDTDTFRMGGLPEQTLLGAQYGCATADGDGVADSSWLWTGVTPGTQVPDLIAVEADEQVPGWPTANGASVVDTVPLYKKSCVWRTTAGGVSHDAPGCNSSPSVCSWDPKMTSATIMAISGVPGGRVFHASSIYWPTTLMQTPAAGQATLNAISFLQSGVVPGSGGTNLKQSATSDTRQLVNPKTQVGGPLAPALPAFAPDDQDTN